ncbi:hypothetical protein [Heyndrickxia shackletonii]|uniref:hypothetical protein n=1 Tax=Heyndrickxia shackletonii TaxID=157838 RepID=UPI0006EC2785|nr:hypothetical protein [Heyndrickxia shackletonii]NEY99237.1 hypothetical protein [Heyndrickxia shackletonii]
MFETSKAYKKAIYAPSRTCTAKVRFEFLDITAFKDNTKSVSSEEIFSNLNQVTDKVRERTAKFMTFEKDYLKLDGSFILPPKSLDETKEVGWISSVLSDENSLFIPNQVLEFTFSEDHSSAGLTIYFDMLSNEYASEFTIDVFDSLGNTLVHEDVVDNTESRYVYINKLSNYRKINITLTKWCKPFHRARIVEVDFGIIKEYQDSSLINLHLIQELDTTSNTLPSDELTFTIDNSSKEFNILNPNGFYEFLTQGQEAYLDFGVLLDNDTFEFVPTGKFFLKEWKSDEGTLTTTFTARDILDSLSNTEVENTEERDITLYDLAEEVLIASNIENYVLSDNLKLIRTKALYNKISYRNLLQLIAVAGMSVTFSDNEGTFMMQQLISANAVIDSVSVSESESITSKDQIIDKIIEPYGNVATFEKNRFKLDGSFVISSADMSEYELGWWSHHLSNENGSFSSPIMVEIDLSKEHTSTNLQILFDTLNNEYASEFDILAYDSLGNMIVNETIVNNSSTFIYQNNLLANCRKVELILKKWSLVYRRARIIEIGFDIPVDNLTFDNIYNEPKIELSNDIKSIELTYYPEDLQTQAIYVLDNPNVKSGSIIKLENCLINTEEDAKNVAEWILRENTKIAKYTVQWRQNPALNLSDKVSIENGYGSNNIANITKQEFEYNGYLTGTTEAKGGL